MLAMIVSEAIYYRDELVFDLTRIGTVLVVLLGGGYALHVIEGSQRQDRAPGAGTKAARGGAAVHRLWFLIPSLVMSSQCLVVWWTTPGLVGFLVLLALPASALVVVFEGLRRAGGVSTARVALALANVCSVVASIGIMAALEDVEPRLAWLALASWSDTLCGVAIVLAAGCVGFVVPCLVAHVVVHERTANRAR